MTNKIKVVYTSSGILTQFEVKGMKISNPNESEKLRAYIEKALQDYK